MAFAGMVALPLSVSAQAGEEDRTSGPNSEEPTPSSEPATEDPALQLQLGETGVGVVPSPLRTVDGYTLEEMRVRVRRARIGVGVSVFAFTAGVAMGAAAAAASAFCFEPPPCPRGAAVPVGITGALLAVGGIVGTGVSGRKLRRRKRDRDSLRQAHYGRPPRVQWDPAESRFVF
jgi:hypothetical protein